jgi:hypothetical protein
MRILLLLGFLPEIIAEAYRSRKVVVLRFVLNVMIITTSLKKQCNIHWLNTSKIRNLSTFFRFCANIFRNSFLQTATKKLGPANLEY